MTTIFGALASLLLAYAIAGLLALAIPALALAWVPLAVMLFVGVLLMPNS